MGTGSLDADANGWVRSRIGKAAVASLAKQILESINLRHGPFPADGGVLAQKLKFKEVRITPVDKAFNPIGKTVVATNTIEVTFTGEWPKPYRRHGCPSPVGGQVGVCGHPAATRTRSRTRPLGVRSPGQRDPGRREDVGEAAVERWISNDRLQAREHAIGDTPFQRFASRMAARRPQDQDLFLAVESDDTVLDLIEGNYDNWWPPAGGSPAGGKARCRRAESSALRRKNRRFRGPFATFACTCNRGVSW